MKVFVAFCMLFVSLSDAYRILVVFPVPGRSHSILGDGFVDTLAEADHEVTVITPFPKQKLPSNVHQVNISSIFDLMKDDKTLVNVAEVATRNIPLHFIVSMGTGLSRVVVTHESVQQLLLDQTRQFDLVIAEWLYGSLLSGFSAVYECPLIWVNSKHPHSQILQLTDESPNPAYTANFMSKSPAPPFSFTQRVWELWMQIYANTLFSFSYYFFERSYYQEMYGPALAKRGRVLPDLYDVMYNGSLTFFNDQPVMSSAFRLPQSGKYIGGYHIDPKTKPLPEDLQKLFDSSKEGVIYFSMGSNLQSTNIPDDIKKSLVKMFGTLKQTVVWKFEDAMEDLPKNVHIVKWAPQPSILKHPNTRIFITHGGKLSTTEAIYYGVPIIGIPVYGDQFSNIIMAVDKGYALQVPFGDDLAYRLRKAIADMLNNPMYTIKMKELTSIFHDLPVTPRQELTHWVEHVVRTKGAPHLRSHALMVPWYQKMYLDLAALVFVILYASCKACKLICRQDSVSRIKKNN